ncbi:MAG: NIPSNAP family protein [Candidatus Rokubacteria bacterium]|nr:NIPSNAP family protein [Candidatus Rokubacteria bacterium]
MIYELRTYTLVPGTQAQYLKLSGEVGRQIRGDRYGKLEGYWSTEFGTLNQLVHLWSFADLVERQRLRAALAQERAWTQEYIPRIRPMMLAQENKILSAVLPVVPPAHAGHVYELRWYRLHPGQVAEWLEQFKTVMPVREKLMHRVGLWQTEIAQLNEVVHMWAFHDLNERAAKRAELAREPEWQAFLAKGSPCLAHMQAIVLNPAPFSPMR